MAVSGRDVSRDEELAMTLFTQLNQVPNADDELMLTFLQAAECLHLDDLTTPSIEQRVDYTMERYDFTADVSSDLELAVASVEPDCRSDHLLARQLSDHEEAVRLQFQLDHELAEQLGREQQEVNGSARQEMTPQHPHETDRQLDVTDSSASFGVTMIDSLFNQPWASLTSPEAGADDSDGLTQFEIDQLPLCCPSSTQTDPQEKCPVCFAAFNSSDLLRILPCLHRFHCSCIESWLKKKAACPLCRHILKS